MSRRTDGMQFRVRIGSILIARKITKQIISKKSVFGVRPPILWTVSLLQKPADKKQFKLKIIYGFFDPHDKKTGLLNNPVYCLFILNFFQIFFNDLHYIVQMFLTQTVMTTDE